MVGVVDPGTIKTGCSIAVLAAKQAGVVHADILAEDTPASLVLADYAKMQALQAEVEALRLKMEKNKKPPTNSGNSSQPPSRDQKADLVKKRKKHRHGPPKGHVKYERKMVANPNHVVEVKPQVCEGCQTDLAEARGHLAVGVAQAGQGSHSCSRGVKACQRSQSSS